MALSSFVGNFVQPVATGNQSVTGVGFQPKVVFFFHASNLAATGTVSNQGRSSLGVAVSTTKRHGGGFINSGAAQTLSNCIYFLNGSLTVMSADLVSMDADGFTVNWTATDASIRLICFLALGGADLTNVTTGSFTVSATGNQSVTGVGFQPDCVLTLGSDFQVTVLEAAALGHLGATTATASWGLAYSDFAASTDRRRYLRTTQMGNMVFNNSITNEFTLVSLDADGFTVNNATAGGTNLFPFVALKGASIKVGNFTEAVGTGAQAITGVGFQPTALLLATVNAAASASLQADLAYSLGVMDGTRRATVWVGGPNASGAEATMATSLNTGKALEMYTPATPTLTDSADLTSFDSDGFTLNWGTVSGTAKQIVYLALGNTRAPVTDTFVAAWGMQSPQIIRSAPTLRPSGSGPNPRIV